MCEDGSSPQTLSCGPHIVHEKIYVDFLLFSSFSLSFVPLDMFQNVPSMFWFWSVWSVFCLCFVYCSLYPPSMFRLCSVGYIPACSFYVLVLIRTMLFLPFDLSSVYVSSTVSSMVSSTVPSALCVCSDYDLSDMFHLCTFHLCSVYVLSLFRLHFGCVPSTVPSTAWSIFCL